MNRAFVIATLALIACLSPVSAQDLVGIRIDGPGEVVENTVTTYRVFAEFDDGGEYEVTLFTDLSLTPGTFATIDQFGRFDAQDVPGDQTETIHARFEFQKQEAIDELEVRIIDVAPAGHALRFDGNDDFVRVVRDVSLEPEELTIEMWAKLDGQQTRNTRLLRKMPDGTGTRSGYIFAADQDGDDRMQLRVHVPELTAAKDVDDHSVYAGQWHHFAGTYSTTEARFYVDGNLVATMPHSRGPAANDPMTDLFIASGRPSPNNSEYFKGELDEVRIWSGARSPSQVRCFMNRLLRGDEEGLVGYWRFDDARGQTARDSSPFGNDGTLGTDDNAEGDAGDPTWILSEADITLPPFDPAVWTMPELVTEVSSGQDWSTSISADGLSIFIASERDGFAEIDIYHATRQSLEDPFGTPLVIQEVSIPGFINHDFDPFISANQLRLYLVRARGTGPGDLYVSERADPGDPWGEPETIDSINTSGDERNPVLSADELTMVFLSNRSGPREVWIASRDSIEAQWGNPEVIPGLEDFQQLHASDLSPDGLILYLGAEGPVGLGNMDTWTMSRESRDSIFVDPTHVPELSSPRAEFDTSITGDGRRLFLTRQRTTNAGDIYVSILEGGMECRAACCVDGTCSMQLEEDCPAVGCTRAPQWQCDGDVDGDGQVNPVDVGQVQSNFGNTTEQAMCNYDVDCDGQINPVDSGIVQSLMGTCNAPRDSCGTGTWFPDDTCESVECP